MPCRVGQSRIQGGESKELYVIVTIRDFPVCGKEVDLMARKMLICQSRYFDSKIAHTLYDRYNEVLNFCVNKATNAFAEIKAFRTSLKGMTDI